MPMHWGTKILMQVKIAGVNLKLDIILLERSYMVNLHPLVMRRPKIGLSKSYLVLLKPTVLTTYLMQMELDYF